MKDKSLSQLKKHQKKIGKEERKEQISGTKHKEVKIDVHTSKQKAVAAFMKPAVTTPATATTSSLSVQKGGTAEKKQPGVNLNKQPLSEEAKEKRKSKFQALKDKKKHGSAKEQKLRDPQIEFMGAEEQATTIWKLYKAFAETYKFEPHENISTLTKDHLFTITDNSLPTAHNIDNFANNVKQFVPDWQALKDKTKIRASPDFIVVTPAALRAVDIIKQVNKAFQNSVKVTKLFARHIKPNEQASILTSVQCRAAVGTPNRLEKLVEMGALTLSHTQYLVVDAGRNDKNMSVFSMPQVNRDFFSFFHRSVVPLLSQPNSNLKICII